ncbi:MAG TPA: hypothetical protein VHQ93_19695 [Chitinophagaceae bacterium]|jgi:hypothetical protein|nr:hypothetical protein [Chitinophagaceae bacterium]
MTLTKYILLTVVFISTISCNWRTKHKKADNGISTNKDTTSLLNVIRSFEPKIYMGTVPKEFYTNRGAFDWWRFPLVYPYSIGCIDVIEYGTIYSDKDKTNYDEGGGVQPLTDYFNKFTFDKAYFVASKFKSPFDSDTVKIVDQYFIFSFSTGTSKEIKGIDNLRKKLKEIKFGGDTSFMTIKDYGNRL